MRSHKVSEFNLFLPTIYFFQYNRASAPVVAAMERSRKSTSICDTLKTTITRSMAVATMLG